MGCDPARHLERRPGGAGVPPALRLFHLSENPDIQSFLPRPVPSPDSGIQGNAVWAIDQEHLPNYLLPRDCPRVTFRATEETSEADRSSLFATTAARVVALETGWRDRIRNCTLYQYEFPVDVFEVADPGAGYHISRREVTPIRVTKIEDLLAELASRHVEVRFLDNLWPLRDQVIRSTLEFSVIRFRNATPKPLA